MSLAHNDSHVSDEAPRTPTQAELYDNLRRIGELEDQKQEIQDEIDERTERLREAFKSVDPDSLLHRVLSSALGIKSRPPKAKATKKKKASSRRRK